MEAAYVEGNRGWFFDYAILGDDNVISRQVAKQYKRLVKRAGMTISEFKSLDSENGSYEFAIHMA